MTKTSTQLPSLANPGNTSAQDTQSPKAAVHPERNAGKGKFNYRKRFLSIQKRLKRMSESDVEEKAFPQVDEKSQIQSRSNILKGGEGAINVLPKVKFNADLQFEKQPRKATGTDTAEQLAKLERLSTTTKPSSLIEKKD